MLCPLTRFDINMLIERVYDVKRNYKYDWILLYSISIILIKRKQSGRLSNELAQIDTFDRKRNYRNIVEVCQLFSNPITAISIHSFAQER
jgi:hypothetical protein